MGYRRGPCSVRQWRDKTLDWLKRLADAALKANKVIILENCLDRPSSMGCSPVDCLGIMESVASPSLRMNLNPGNFVNRGQDPVQGARLLGPYTVNLHIKDIRTPGNNSTFCLPGDGVARIRDVLRILHDFGFSGNVTIEPHLRMHESYHYSGWDDYVRAAKRIIELLIQAGFNVKLASD